MKDQEKLARASRVAEVIRKWHLDAAEIAEAASVSPQAVYKWKKTGNISRDAAKVLASMADVSVEWILTGNDQQELITINCLNSDEKITVLEHELPPWPNPDLCGFIVKDTAMTGAPGFPPSSILICDKSHPPTPGGFVVALNGNDLIFRGYSETEDGFILTPINNNYRTLRNNSEIQIIADVVAFRVKLPL